MNSLWPHGSRSTRLAASLAIPLACLATAATASASSGGTLDLTVNNLQVNQAIPGVTLIAGKSTMVRSLIGVSGTVPPGTEVDGLMRVFVNGVETPDSPLFSENGPLVPTGGPIDPLDENSTLNFTVIPPESNNVMFTIEINPAGDGQVCETNFNNNTNSTASLNFECAEKAEYVYVPIDYRLGGGGGPNVADPDLIDPGAGDNFIQAVFPIPDWDYRRSDSPSKLWTANLSSSGGGANLASALLTDLQMMVPQPDLIYGWVPGPLPGYNGLALSVPGQAAVGNTETIRHQRTFAHETGHLLGRNHINNLTNVYGVDVEHQLNITEGLPRIKATNLNDIMVPGLLTNQAWVYDINWEAFNDFGLFDCNQPVVQAGTGETLLISGMWHFEDDVIEVLDTVAFHGGVPTGTVPMEEANLALRVHHDGSVEELGLKVGAVTDSCADTDSHDEPLPFGSFLAVLPQTIEPASIERVEIFEVATGSTLHAVQRSASAPELSFTSHAANATLDREVELRWAASDFDGDDLRHYLRYSPDGVRMVPLASNTRLTNHRLDMRQIPELRIGGFFEVMTSDGLRTTRKRLSGVRLSTEAAGGSPPETHVLTPDPGKSFPVGANVILHASGWDLEDRQIEGADLEWSSDIDGFLGTGRLTTTTELSVGSHVLTVTATDSGGATSSDTTAITVTDRIIPGTFCQEDIGSGGPGSAVLELCGGDLSTGTTADVMVSGAAPSTSIWIIAGGTNTPTPAIGGILVPVPIESILPGVTDASGNFAIEDALVGGGGPGTLYVQAVYLDFTIPTSFGITNAVQAELLP